VCRKRSLEACSERLKPEDVTDRTDMRYNHMLLRNRPAPQLYFYPRGGGRKMVEDNSRVLKVAVFQAQAIRGPSVAFVRGGSCPRPVMRTSLPA